MNLDEANKLWFEFQPIGGAKFGLNQSVCITEGANNGNHAVVISLLSLEPVSYLYPKVNGLRKKDKNKTLVKM